MMSYSKDKLNLAGLNFHRKTQQPALLRLILARMQINSNTES